MSKSKYVVGRFRRNHILGVLIFHEVIVHSDIAKNFSSVLGAGFFVIDADKYGSIDVKVFGESISLGVKSRPEDKDIIKRALGLTYE